MTQLQSTTLSYLDTLSQRLATMSGQQVTVRELLHRQEASVSLVAGFKRAMDVVLVLCAFPFLLPIFAAVALSVKLDSPGSVFFRQKRTGLNGETFFILKFRTMTEAAGSDLKASQSREGDMRHTRMGRVLRKSSLDELPQLWNVLKGDMSLIGPRPHARYHDMLFVQYVPGYAQRFRVKPGLSGLAQVHGCRGFIETEDQIRSRTDLDNHYIDNWSLWMDVVILFRTVGVVLKGINAH